MSAGYSIREATADDVGIIVYQRSAMFRAMSADEAGIRAMEAPFRTWLIDKLDAGLYRGWLAVRDDDQKVVSGAGLWLHDWIPSPMALPTAARGYILNVYTEPDARRQGLARRLVEEILSYCRAHEIRIVSLHASDKGRPIYQAIGFKATNEMRIQL